MAADGGAKLAASFDETHDPAIPAFAALAKELGVHLLIGSLAIVVAGGQGAGKTANRSYLFTPAGQVAARYSKIHLFDVDLSGGEALCRIRHGGRRRLRRAGAHALGQAGSHHLL